MDTSDAAWTFVLDFYGRNGVKDACITLQNRAGVDVNVLLFALYLTITQGASPGDADIRDMEASVADFRCAVIMPLRAVRDELKQRWNAVDDPAIRELRSGVLNAELQAERQQYRHLAGHLMRQPLQNDGAADRTALIAQVVACYTDLAEAGDELRAVLQDAIDVLATAARSPN